MRTLAVEILDQNGDLLFEVLAGNEC